MPVNFHMIVQGNIEMWNHKYKPKQIHYWLKVQPFCYPHSPSHSLSIHLCIYSPCPSREGALKYNVQNNFHAPHSNFLQVHTGLIDSPPHTQFGYLPCLYSAIPDCPVSGFNPGSTFLDPSRGQPTSHDALGWSIIPLEGLVHPQNIDWAYLMCPHSH